MKIFFATVLILFLHTIATFSQSMTIQFNSLNNYQFFINNIWDMTIVNPMNEQYDAVLNVEIRTKDFSQIFLATSKPFNVNRGINRLSTSSIIVDRMEYGLDKQSDYLSQTGFLPEGNYLMEAHLLSSNGESKMLGVANAELHVQPIVPPVLLSPFNGEEIVTLAPTLLWLPPAPVPQRYLNYSLRLVELSEGSTAAAAIHQNIPLIDENNLRKPSLIIREGLNLLEFDHHYAWQITAYMDDKILASTDIWTFTPIRKSETKKIIPGLSYWILSETLDGGYNLTDDTLRVSYKNTTRDTLLNYKIINLSSVSKEIKGLQRVPIRFGANNIDMPLKEINGMKYNETYLFVVTDSKKREFKMRFVYGNPKKRTWETKTMTKNPDKTPD